MNIRFFSEFSKLFFWTVVSYVLTSVKIQADTKECRQQFKEALEQQSTNKKQRNLIHKQNCPIAHRLVEWIHLQKEGTFSQINHFLTNNPKWPRQDTLRRQAEKDLNSSIMNKNNLPHHSNLLVGWFTKYPPLTKDGLMAYAHILHKHARLNQRNFHQGFIQMNISGSESRSVIQKYPGVFPEPIIYEKVSQYLNKEESSSARILLPFLSSSHKKIVDRRLKLQDQTRNKDVTPTHSLSDNSELLFEWVRAYRKTDQNDHAKELLCHLSQQPMGHSYIDDEDLWTERNILARRYLEEKSYQKAYDILNDHGLVSGENFAHAEFMLGWISLKFLHAPDQALLHFQNLYSKVKTPISTARAAYWMGKTHKTLKSNSKAKEWFTRARNHKATYYGQLAIKELSGAIPSLKPKAHINISPQERQKFLNQPFVKAIKLLIPLHKRAMAESFAFALAEDVHNEQEQYLLIEFLKQVMGNGTTVEAYKKSAKKQAPLLAPAYPQLTYVPSNIIQPAFAHAIIRQESRFRHDEKSTAGALGLMQLMPTTAEQISKTHKIKKRPLTNPQHNVTLGCHHLKDLLKYYNGSHILAAAAYNAGTKPVDEWIQQLGDPRHPHVDSVDWVESIPYFETRNYVQRVMENYHCYK